jgi:hypothetical protein
MPRLNIFVACPYMLFPLDDYKKVFHSVARAYDIEFKFADEQITNPHVLAEITNYIRDHSFSLFDITGWNPNVALELGIAVGLGKKYFILLNTKIEPHKDAPSDIKGLDRIQYLSNVELEAKLKLLIKQELPETRNKSDSAFDGLKSRIVEALESEQGLGLTKFSTAIGEDKTLVQSVARAMLATNELKTVGAKKGTVYFTADADLRKYRNK